MSESERLPEHEAEELTRILRSIMRSGERWNVKPLHYETLPDMLYDIAKNRDNPRLAIRAIAGIVSMDRANSLKEQGAARVAHPITVYRHRMQQQLTHERMIGEQIGEDGLPEAYIEQVSDEEKAATIKVLHETGLLNLYLGTGGVVEGKAEAHDDRATSDP